MLASAYCTSRCAGLTSPDITAKSAISSFDNLLTRLAESPIEISSNVLFSMYSSSAMDASAICSPRSSRLKDVKARRIAQRCKSFLGRAHRGRRALPRRLFGEPGFPLGPPGPLAGGCFALPSVGIDVTLSGQPPADLIPTSRMARLADDPRIVSPAREDEGQFEGRYEIGLVHGLPGRDVICHRADREGWSAKVRDPHRATIDFKMSHGEVVVQEKPAQIFGMHAVGHARGIGIPRHQIVHGLPAAEQVLADETRPDEIVGAQDLESTGHLIRVQITAVPHHVLQIRNLAFRN